MTSIKRQESSSQNEMILLDGIFETPSSSIFKKKDTSFVVIGAESVQVFRRKGDKKPKKQFSYKTGIDVERLPGPGFSFIISDKKNKKDQLQLFAANEPGSKTFSEAIQSNQLTYEVNKRKQELNQVTVEADRFDEMWNTDTCDEGVSALKASDTGAKSNEDVKPPEFEGWIMKRGGFMKKYKRRYVVLFFYRLTYYLSDSEEDMKKPRGEIDVTGKCSLKIVKGKKGKKNEFGLTLSTPTRDYHFLCENKQDFGNWSFLLKKTIEQAKKSSIVRQPKEDSDSKLAGATSSANDSGDAGENISSTPKTGGSNGAVAAVGEEDAHGDNIMTKRIAAAKTVPWNRRSKGGLYFDSPFTNKKDGWMQAEISFKLENLGIVSEKARNTMTLDGSHQAAGKIVSSVYMVIKGAPFSSVPLTGEQAELLKADKTVEFSNFCRTDEVHDTRHPEFVCTSLIGLPVDGDRAIRADVYVSAASLGSDVLFGSAFFTVSDVLKEVVSLPVRVMSKHSDNTLLHARYEEGHNHFEPTLNQGWGLMANTQILRNPENRTRVTVREEVWETATSFQIPLLYLKLRLSELVSSLSGVKHMASKKLHREKRKEDEVETQITDTQKRLATETLDDATKASLKSTLVELQSRLKKLKQKAEDPRELAIMHWIFKDIKMYYQSVDMLGSLYRNIPGNAYKNKKISLTFKPSTAKSKKPIQMLPTNLHAQILFVGNPVKDLTGGKSQREQRSRGSIYESGGFGQEDAGEDEEAEGNPIEDSEDVGENGFFKFPTNPDKLGRTAYEIVTFGAAAAHCLKFKKGGLYSLKQKLNKLLGNESSAGIFGVQQAGSTDSWVYQGEGDVINGPYDSTTMRQWFRANYFPADMMIARYTGEDGEPEFKALSDFFDVGQEFLAVRESPRPPSASVVASIEEEVGRMSDDDSEDDEAEDVEGLTEDEKEFRAKELYLGIQKREDLCVCQSLSALVLSFSIKLELMSNTADASIFFKQLERVGYLFASECLVTTQGAELGMLEDYFVAMEALKNFQFRLQRVDMDEDAESTWKYREMLTTLQTKLAALDEKSAEYVEKAKQAKDLESMLVTESLDYNKKVWFFLGGDDVEQGPFSTYEMREWYPDYLHDDVKVRLESEKEYLDVKSRFPNGNPFPEPSMAAVRVGKGTRQVMMERLDSKVVVTLVLDTDTFSMLPTSLQNGGLINVHPALWQQGINEFQTIANMKGGDHVKFQNTINTIALGNCQAYRQGIHQHGKYIGYSQEELEIHEKQVDILAALVKAEDPHLKNCQILEAAECCVRLLKGGRGTNCKSAKDRTSMSVTLEQSRLIYYNHIKPNVPVRPDKTTKFLNDEDRAVLWMANEQRKHGVRIQNSKKNQGKMKFAFNKFQRGQLPKMYRPPRECIGKAET